MKTPGTGWTKAARAGVILGMALSVALSLGCVQAFGQQETPEEQTKRVQTENEKIRYLNSQIILANQERAAGNFDRAASILNSALAVDATRDLLWAQLGDIYRSSGDYVKAINSYQRAIGIRPAVGAYHNNLGDAYSKSKRVDEALSEYAIAIQVDNHGAATYAFNMGAVLTNNGRPEEAISAFDLTIKLDPTRADAYYHKGVNMVALSTLQGKAMVSPLGTRAALQKYLELNPTGQYAKQATVVLQAVGSESSRSLPNEDVLAQAFDAGLAFNSRGEYRAGMEAEIARLGMGGTASAVPKWAQKARDFWADPVIAAVLQAQVQMQVPNPAPPQCNSLDQGVQIEDAMPSGPGHCAGEADFWFTNASGQAIDCAIIFHKNGRYDPGSLLTFALSPGEKLGGTGKISSCGADSGQMQYQCFAHTENAANSCTGKVQWQQ